MESSWPEAHRRDDDPQPPQFRAFALPRISIATPRWAGKKGEGNEAEGFKQCRDSIRERRAYTHTRTRTYIPYTRIHVTAFTLNPICLG